MPKLVITAQRYINIYRGEFHITLQCAKYQDLQNNFEVTPSYLKSSAHTHVWNGLDF